MKGIAVVALCLAAIYPTSGGADGKLSPGSDVIEVSYASAAADTTRVPRSGVRRARAGRPAETPQATADESKPTRSTISSEKGFSFEKVKDYVSEDLYFKVRFPGEVEVKKVAIPSEGFPKAVQSTFTCRMENGGRFSVAVIALGDEGMNENPDEFLTGIIENIKAQSEAAAKANGAELVFTSVKIELQGVGGYELSGKVYVDGKLVDVSTTREFMVSGNVYIAEHGGPAEDYDDYSGWLDTFKFVDVETLQNLRKAYLMRKAIDDSGILKDWKK